MINVTLLAKKKKYHLSTSLGGSSDLEFPVSGEPVNLKFQIEITNFHSMNKRLQSTNFLK